MSSGFRREIFSKQLLDLKKTIVLMGKINEKGEIIPKGTGFLVTISGIFHLVTAKHVIFDREKDAFMDQDIRIYTSI